MLTMSERTKAAFAILIVSTLACSPLGGGAVQGGAPSPTPPPIPTRPIATATVGPAATTPAEVVPESQEMALVFGSARGKQLGLYLLGLSGEFVSPLNLGESVLNATWPAPSPDGTKI